MSNVRITEFAGLGQDPNGSVQAVAGPPVAQQVVPIGVASSASSAFGVTTTIVRLSCEAICAIYVGSTTPTATSGVSSRFLAGQTEYFRVAPGDKLAVIADT